MSSLAWMMGLLFIASMGFHFGNLTTIDNDFLVFLTVVVCVLYSIVVGCIDDSIKNKG